MEAEALYVRQLHLPERVQATSGEFVIWDVGLGAAANALTVIRLVREGLANSNAAAQERRAPKQLRLVSFDLTTAAAAFALEHGAELGYVTGYESALSELVQNHSVKFGNDLFQVEWKLVLGDFPAMLAQEPERRLPARRESVLSCEHAVPEAGAPVIFLESGLRFEADVLRGQKTGFFLDQRENRREVETLARGRRVLNAFSFSGGFSVYAARGGAAAVTDLDISAHALAAAQRNFALNQNFPGVAACHHDTAQGDAFEWLAASAAKFDLVVLDPPSLAKRATEQAGALRAYERLATLGIARLAPDGILVAGSCSAHVPAEEFFEVIRRAAAKSGRKFAELKTLRHPPDHPATFKEGEYLKVIYLKFAT